VILDLHVHSVFSLDSPTAIETYARRMTELRTEHRLDGFVLMEHNRLLTPADCDLAALGRQYDLIIMAGVEADTYWGHMLVFGLPSAEWDDIRSNGARKQEPLGFCQRAAAAGAVVVPAHPFRGWLGAGEMAATLPGVTAIEGVNASNSDDENRAAMDFVARHGFAATGGSDSHFPAELGGALTEFERDVRDLDALVAELKAGRCRPLRLADARR
jgi:predicted metal-dependent phosphoesterase TrpH